MIYPVDPQDVATRYGNPHLAARLLGRNFDRVRAPGPPPDGKPIMEEWRLRDEFGEISVFIHDFLMNPPKTASPGSKTP